MIMKLSKLIEEHTFLIPGKSNRGNNSAIQHPDNTWVMLARRSLNAHNCSNSWKRKFVENKFHYKIMLSLWDSSKRERESFFVYLHYIHK